MSIDKATMRIYSQLGVSEPTGCSATLSENGSAIVLGIPYNRGSESYELFGPRGELLQRGEIGMPSPVIGNIPLKKRYTGIHILRLHFAHTSEAIKIYL